MFVSVKMVSSLNQYYTGFVQDLKDLDNWRNLAKVKGNLEWFGIIILVNSKSGKIQVILILSFVVGSSPHPPFSQGTPSSTEDSLIYL